jgi:hypothetical protein
LTVGVTLPCINIEASEPDRKKKWFLWGTAFTWTLSIPFIVGIFNAFKGISGSKTTGLGAIAGGLAEAYVTVGLILAFVLPVGAIVLLVRSFYKAHPMRAVFSVLYICWSVLTLVVASLFVSLTFMR